MINDHISKSEFLLEFFGILGGRDFGTPKQYFKDNPNYILEFVEKCKENGKPAFMSVQPRRTHHEVLGIEKIFYDFDYGKASDEMTDKEIIMHKKKMENEVRIFLYSLKKQGKEPLIVKTRKGYHVYIYFDKVYDVGRDEDLYIELYAVLYNRFLTNHSHKYEYADTTSVSDIYRLSRIPTSVHQKTGKKCDVLDFNLKPTKLRSVEFFKMYGLRLDDLTDALDVAKINLEKKRKELDRIKKEFDKMEKSGGFSGDIRPCFQVRMDKGEMSHSQRLAWLTEIFHAGYNTPEKMLVLCEKTWKDFNYSKSMEQIDDFFKHQRWVFNPYKCSTVQEKKWCLGSQCGIFNYRKERGVKNGKR